MSGGVDYFTHCDSRGTHDLWQGEAEHVESGYLTDLISARAVDCIGRFGGAKDAPFFLSVHYTAPHWPWETRADEALAAEVADNLFHLHGGNIHTYRTMIEQMDEGIGDIMAALVAQGVDDDTLVVFTSDNGGERFSDSWPLVGGKMDLTEGGIRVPWIAHWPNGIAAGATSEQLCMTMDWTATMLEAAGVAADPAYPLDGVSLMGVLGEPPRTFERPLHWRMNHRGQRALRQGSWKYLRVDGHDYLFDLDADERERANVERDHAADPRRRDRQPRLRRGRHAAALAATRRCLAAMKSSDPHDLERFVVAQKDVYEQVLGELARGEKASHWMWFVFPQLKALGRSGTAKRFGIASRAEAAAYLAHPLLGARLLDCTRLMLFVEGKTALQVLGSPDDLKFRSSMTLFAALDPTAPEFQLALAKYYAGAADDETLRLLGKA